MLVVGHTVVVGNIARKQQNNPADCKSPNTRHTRPVEDKIHSLRIDYFEEADILDSVEQY